MRADPAEALLPHYLAELAYLREAGAAFARRHPQVAARLELDPTGSADPHVERLIESFAFLTARLRRLHDAQSPEIARSLLEVLQPSLVQPVPSMAIAEFTVDPRQARSANGITVPAGTMLFAPASDGAVVRLRTAYPVPLWPLRLAEAELLAPGALDDGAAMPALAATLRLRLACLGGRRLAELALPSLRIFLHGPRGTGAALHELLAHRLLGVLVAEPGTGRVLRRLPAGAVRPLGLESHEALLPQPAHAHDGYRLLQEYFAFPEKFLFVELTGLGPGGLGDGEAVDLLFLLSRPPPDTLALDAGCFRLGCTPIVNLFRKTSEPIRLDLARLEHPLEADAREARACEIHSIEAVTATAPGGASRPVRPFFSCTHEEIETAGTAFWTARREPTARPDGRGSDVLIAFVDEALVPTRPPGEALFADLLCTNRGLAERMPAGARSVSYTHLTLPTKA
jgi:type VI secretion system protein ImpG